jgi:ABC-type molybdate transport system substrate-binding protein
MKAHSQTNALTVKERWEIGRSLLEEIRKVETEKRFALVKKKASEYGVSYVSLYQYMYFAKYVPDIEKFMEEHPNISWNYVVNDFIRKVKKSGRFLKVIEKI